MATMNPLLLAEITGPYGPFSLPERVVQKIWWTGDFQQAALQTLSGKTLRRVKPGRWNQQEGPDFIGAVVEIDGREVQGDVEIHFYAEDWQAHGHGTDAAFANVVLHVLLFPPRRPTPCPTLSGREPETFVLLPHLHEDIEDYANHEALLALEAREKSAWYEALLAHPETERLALLRAKADVRWQQKIRFARQRLDTHGWANACHQFALETLGLKRNRAPMSALALRHTPEAMRGATVDALFAEQNGLWRLAGLRPANHPRHRLEQYLALLNAHPDWPERLLLWACALPDGTDGDGTDYDTARFRRKRGVQDIVKKLHEEVFAGAIGGTRLHTLAVDALLPLLAAAAENGVAATAPIALADYWFHWPLGDIPANLAAGLRETLPAEDKRAPLIGNGLFQGLLQLSNEHG
ncbi:MAG: DUF2851 family protein [Puniceicoccales bacterium]|jgi:hypothetical protein|nr:DUF2851 family protein [Puniceicoccales bacterium]